MAETIMEKVRRFAGADPSVTDTVLEMCYRAAVEWYKAAGVEEDESNDLWLFWVCNLAAWMYDNRGNADANAAIPIYIVTSVHQLRKPAGAGSNGSNGSTGSTGSTGDTGSAASGSDGASSGGDA